MRDSGNTREYTPGRARAYDDGDGTLFSHTDGQGVSAQDGGASSRSSQTVVDSSTDRLYFKRSRNIALVQRRTSLKTRQSLGTGQSLPPRGFYAISVFTLVCLLIILLGILVPMIVIHNTASARYTALRENEESTVVKWASVLRNVMIDGLASARALEGYAMSSFPELHLTNNASNRSSRANLSEKQVFFSNLASVLDAKRPALAMQAICPAGVITLMYPYDKDSVGRNLLSPSDSAYQYTPTPQDTVDSGKYSIVGPRRSTIASLQGIWVIITRIPIYNSTNRTRDTFWGFVFLLVNVSGALDFIHLDTMARDNRLNYALYDNAAATRHINVIASTLPPNTTQEEYRAFIADSTTTDILSPFSTLHIAVRSRESYVSLTPANITSIVLWTLFGALLLLGIAIAAVLWCTRVYDAAAHAPKMPPFAMLTIGPRRGEELWDLAADQMVEVTERLDLLLERQMVRHRAYQIQQVHPLTTSYVTRSVATAVQMAFSIIEELHNSPIDDPLRRLLGDEGSLLMSYAVHWCTDAAVRVESLEGTYRYEGPDVVFGGRMWAFAAPGVVTASEAVVQALPCHGLSSVVVQPYQMVSVQTQIVSEEAEASGSVGNSRNMMLYLVACAANPSISSRAAKAAEAIVPLLRNDSVQVPSQPYGMIIRGDSGIVGAGASGMMADAPARSVASACLVSTAWDPVGLMGAHGSTTSAQQPRRKISPRGHLSALSSSNRNPLPPESLASAQSLRTVKRNASSYPNEPRLVQIEADSVTHALLRPLIPRALDIALHTAFVHQFITLDIRYCDVRVLVYYFYLSYKILFRPLAAPERHNIFRRLVTAFGVPQQRILEHLAARGAVQWLSDVRRINGLMHQRSSIEHSHSSSTSTTSSSCDSPLIAQQRRC